MKDKKRILIVDDDEDFLEATRIVVEKSGYAVETCVSAKECLAKLKVVRPDLIICDVMMETDHSGFDLCRELKRVPDTRDVPIIMLTAVDQKYSMNFSATAGDAAWLPVDDFIDKPVEAKVLIERIRKYVG